MLEFDYIERPPLDSFKRALGELWVLGALEVDGSLSTLGKQMAMFPVEPTMAKALILSDQYACSIEVMAVLAMLSSENLLITPSTVEQQGERQSASVQSAQQARAAYTSPYGDHITLLRLHDAYMKESKNERKDWCKRHLINDKAMKKVLEVEQQLREYWDTLGWPLKSCRQTRHVSSEGQGTGEEEWLTLRKCFTAAFFNQLAIASESGERGRYETLLERKEVQVHPTSALFQKKAIAVVYHSLVLTTKQYMRGVLRVEPDWIVELQPELRRIRAQLPSSMTGTSSSGLKGSNKLKK